MSNTAEERETRELLCRLGPPGEARQTKLDILEGVRRHLGSELRRVPDWVLILRDQVQAGEL